MQSLSVLKPFPVPKPALAGLLPYDTLLAADVEILSESDRARVVDGVQEAVCAAMSGERELCEMRWRRVDVLCAGSPHAAGLAAAELRRLLGIDIVARHLLVCHKLRHLRRELESFAQRLQAAADSARPLPASAG